MKSEILHDFKEQKIEKKLNTSNIIPINLDDYKIIDNIGKGSFGIVYKVMHIPSSKIYASKEIIYNRNSNKEIQQSFGREIKSYSIIDNPAILKLIGYNECNFQRKPNPTMILEYMKNGSVEKFLRKDHSNNPTSLKTRFFIILGSALGMKYLHSHGIIHRDIKADNILLNEFLYPKICDFGCSEISDKDLTELQMDEILGSPLNMAPEIFSKSEHYSYKVDVYAYSIVIYQLITNKDPFPEFKSKFKLFKAVEKGERPKIDMIEDEKIRLFLTRCWSEDPSKRPEFREIAEELMQEHFLNYFNVDLQSLNEYLLLFDESLTNPKLNGEMDIQSEIEKGNIEAIRIHALRLYFGIGVDKNYEEAARYFRLAAEKGDPESMVYYARVLQKGQGIEQNKEKAAEYYKKSASLGNTNAMFNLGYMYRNGDGVNTNKKEAARYFKMAADLGDFEALNIYTIMVDDKEFDCNNKNEDILQLYKKAADKGSYSAMFNYATELLKTSKTNENKQTASKYFKKAADHGNLPSMLKYGFMLWKGYGVQKNKKEAEKYFGMAIDRGNNGKKIEFVVLLPNNSGILNRKKDIIQFLKNILDANNIDEIIDGNVSSPVFGSLISLETILKQVKDNINDIDTQALFFIGLYLLKQDSNFEAKELGVNLIKKAADRGNIHAMSQCGKLAILKGDMNEFFKYLKMKADLPISKENQKKGFSLYEELDKNYEELNDLVFNPSEMSKYEDLVKIQSMNFSAHFLYSNEENKINKKEAAKYYKKSADLGHPDSIYCYALMLLKGDGIEENKKEAARYFQILADRGDIKSSAIIGIMLYEGDVIEADYLKAASYLKKAVDNNFIHAFETYGCMLYEGKGVEIDKKQAYNYLYKAALVEFPKAQFLVGKMLYEGDGVAANKQEALKYIKKAANQGEKEAILYIRTNLKEENMEILQNDNENDYRMKEIANYCKMGAEKGDVEKMLQYGLIVLYEDQNLGDPKEAINYIKKAADQNDFKSALLYGSMLFFGQGIEVDKNKAMHYLKIAVDHKNSQQYVKERGMAAKLIGSIIYGPTESSKNEAARYLKISADCGDSESMFNYGLMMLKKEPKEAAKYFKNAADNGEINSCFYYGEMLYNGNGIPENKIEAIKYYKLGAERNEINSMFKYGALLLTGDGIPQNQSLAFKYLKPAADHGIVAAIFSCGHMYHDGEGVTKNLREAARYFKMGSDKGHAESLLMYGLMLFEGDGIPVNKKEAARYFKMGAERNHPSSMFHYGKMLLTGDGIPMNQSEGWRLIKQAYNLGSNDAKYFLLPLSNFNFFLVYF